jgi:hypothetical protein
MTVFAVFLIGLSLALPIFFASGRQKKPLPWMFLLCGIHIAAVFTQNEMLKTVTADAHLYYYDTDMYTAYNIGLGTSFIVYLTQFLKLTMNLDFVELMLMFGMTGTITILLLCNWISENFQGYLRNVGLILCVLPGLHFWTSSIGKDAPMSIGIFLIILSVLNIRKRLLMFFFGALICLMTRPHILIILIITWISANILRESRPIIRLVFVIFAIAFIPVSQVVIQNFLGIDILNSNDLSKLISERQNYFTNTLDGGVIYISNPATRVIYFTFNPLFYNASSTMSLMASIENLIMIIMMLRIFIRFRAIEERYKTFAVFLALFVLAMVLFQGLGGYNIGLALRQKVMIYPAFIMLFLLCEKGSVERNSERHYKNARSTSTVSKNSPVDL